MSAIKKRTIHVENMSCAGCERTITDALHQLHGIQDVNADHRNGTVTVTYDVLSIDLEHIEERIVAAGYAIHDSFMHRIKDRIIHFTEENERDNLNAPPMPCCSDPDDMLERNKQ